MAITQSPSVGQGASNLINFVGTGGNIQALTTPPSNLLTNTTAPDPAPTTPTPLVPTTPVVTTTPANVTPAPTNTPTTPTVASTPTITLDTGSGSTPVQVTNPQTTGAANASDDPATNAAAKKMLESVDAELAARLGSKYKAPSNQQERVKLVAEVANSLKGAEKTAFLNKLGALGKDFGLNFGQPSIVSSTANLTAAQKQIHDALYTEFQTGKAFSKSDSGSTPAATTPTPDTRTGSYVPSPKITQGALDLMATVRTETREQTRARIAAWDIDGNGKLDRDKMELYNGAGVEATRWDDIQGHRLDEPGHNSIDAVTDELRRRAGVQ
jgi:hypothetical protein